jgi:cobalt/nickel transport system permease protein
MGDESGRETLASSQWKCASFRRRRQTISSVMTSYLTPLVCPDSPLRRLDPRWKLSALAIALLITACLQSLAAATSALIASIILATLARLPIRACLVRLKVLLPVLILFTILLPFVVPDSEPILIGPVRLSTPGIRLAFLFIVKALAIFTLALALTASSPVNATLQAAAYLRVPGRLVHITMLTYRYLFLFAAELGRLRLALRVRGYRNRPTMHCYRTIGNVAGTLLVRSSERAERVAQAMRCRGFDGRFRSLTEFRTSAMDVLGFAVIVAGFGALAVWEILG